MAKQTRRDTVPEDERELTDEEWQDPARWESEGWLLEGNDEPLTARIIEFRADEMALIEDAARAAGISTSRFIRSAAVRAVGHGPRPA